ncbi:hypothetical protein LTR85_000070 [Meristemomyces frigidus]|nr:hypothetical protein LTR85_000070 [Meristemomyces frigidus]
MDLFGTYDPDGPRMKKGRPRKVLQAKRVTKARSAIYDSNATNSPLLRLPPEVRNRIWRYVLCGNTVRVTVRNDQLERAVCGLHSTPEEEALHCKQTNKDYHTSYTQRHRSCLQLLHFSILRACRQAHQEAALLPYQESIFTFSSPEVLSRFLGALNPEQSRAITSIALLREQLTWFIQPASNHTALLDRRLKSLETLIVFLEFRGAVDIPSGEADRHQLAKCFLQFRHLHITTAVVACYRNSPWILHRNSSFATKAADAWTEEVESKLKEPYDKSLEAERRAEKKAEKQRGDEREAEEFETYQKQQAEEKRQRRAQDQAGGRLRALHG